MFSVSWLVSLPLFLQHHYPLPHDNMGSGCAAVCWRSGHALLSVHFWVRLFVLLVCLYFLWSYQYCPEDDRCAGDILEGFRFYLFPQTVCFKTVMNWWSLGFCPCVFMTKLSGLFGNESIHFLFPFPTAVSSASNTPSLTTSPRMHPCYWSLWPTLFSSTAPYQQVSAFHCYLLHISVWTHLLHRHLPK